jgi:hypothetical protein
MAQSEIARERSSLRGIEALGFTVNVETNVSVTDKGELQITSLKEMGLNALQNANIDIIPDQQIQESYEIPFLYLHINSMDAGRGLVPFSLTLYFYQPVELILNRNSQAAAITWESGSVGIVSYDQMDIITDAARELINEFISDFNRANRSN